MCSVTTPTPSSTSLDPSRDLFSLAGVACDDDDDDGDAQLHLRRCLFLCLIQRKLKTKDEAAKVKARAGEAKTHCRVKVCVKQMHHVVKNKVVSYEVM
ncbi:hypothetical protein CEXT_763751 [Caerostris extrusa]|uniref:Uncharacterized protein n=1 Tax=Caerostris extrusa TaxID=172846 RepID=A0AAV4WEP0_CAEEX|nr:hypothetical protein CEXT_763751 [Caerostris extrusa]